MAKKKNKVEIFKARPSRPIVVPKFLPAELKLIAKEAGLIYALTSHEKGYEKEAAYWRSITKKAKAMIAVIKNKHKVGVSGE